MSGDGVPSKVDIVAIWGGADDKLEVDEAVTLTCDETSEGTVGVGMSSD